MFTRTTTKQTVFKDEDQLSKTTIVEPVNRVNELQQVGEALQPLLNRRESEDVLISGPTGTGKTTLAKHAQTHLEEKGVTTVYINGWSYTTRSGLIGKCLDTVGRPAVRRGITISELVNRMQRTIQKHNAVAVFLDEFDQIRDASEFVYDLMGVSKSGDTPVSLVMVSQTPDIDIDPRCLSRLQLRTIEFDHYDEGTLTDILDDRVERAFKSDVVDEDVPRAIARRVREQRQDCWQAIDVLHQAGRIADRDGNKAVSLAEVEKAMKSVMVPE